MKRLLIYCVATVFSLTSATSFAQPSDADQSDANETNEVGEANEAKAPIAFGFDLLPFVGTSSASPDRRRIVSLNLGGGLSGGIDSTEVAGGFNIDTGRVRGVQVAGGFNVVTADLQAAQIAGGFNLLGGEAAGAQVAGGFNFAQAGFDGAQVAGGFNVSGSNADGAQVAGGLNIAAGAVNGVQVAGGINIAGGGVAGSQVSPVNISAGHVSGVQVGVINIAKSADAGVGLIGIYWDGYVQAEVFGSDDGLTMTGIRHGSGAFYNVYFVGTRPFADGDLPFAYGLGFGWKAALGNRVEFSLDLTGTTVVPDTGDWNASNQVNLIKLRPMVSVDLVDGVALFAGPTATVLLAQDDAGVNADDYALIDAWKLTDEGSDTNVALWPGFTGGVRFF